MPSLKLPLANGRTESNGHWRSAGEFENGREKTPEFAPGVLDEPASRRGLLQFFGAGAGLAALAGCLKQPEEKILPYTRQPEEVVPGNPLHYATASVLGGHAVGLLATSNEGRPTKIEGNPEHVASRGRTGPLEQASVLSLYDPQRLKTVRHGGTDRAFRDFLGAMAAKAVQLREKQGEGLRFLLEPSSSPLVLALRKRLQSTFPKAKFASWSALPSEGRHDGSQLAFGGDYEARVALEKADVIACLDADPLSGLPGTLHLMRGWAQKRDSEAGPMNRLYAVESNMSVTGMNADNRLRVKPTAVQRIAVALLARLGGEGLPDVKLDEKQRRFVDALAKDLQGAGRAGVVLAGDRQPAIVHAIAHAINAKLGSSAVAYAKPVLHDTDAGPRALSALAQEIRDGKVDTLVMTAWNPAYGAPADIGFGKALSQVPTSVYLTSFEDETAARAGWVLPAVHPLESWQDARAYDGTITLVQPLIAPLFSGVHEVEVLAALLGEGDRSPYMQLRVQYGHGSDAQWEKWLSDGFIDGTATPAESVALRREAVLAEARKVPVDDPEGLQLNVIPDYRVWDGRFGNNAWLQELPDPVTKITWENVALVSPTTAGELGLSQGDFVDLGLRGPPARAPVVVMPGHADGVVTVSIGYGRSGAAETTAKDLGFDTATLRHGDFAWFASGLTVARTGQKQLLAQTQEHHSMEGRVIAVATTKEKFPEVEKDVLEEHRGMPETIHAPVDYSHGYKWGMAIDLGKCTGCNACMVACQSENNVPVVGKERVWRSREMHWLRVDRYFTGDELSDPGVVLQPLMCVHCETAPCEYVCPVNATVHSDEGLNEMVYNRCVGTRYCSNNCPYKVRRFNFFRYTYDYTDTEKMVLNPDVTVRARGVMEKCTYCVQRIERARIRTRVEDRQIRDADLQSACAQACPTDAIVFGNLNDREARVTHRHGDARRYDLLHELGTRPRTAYLARVMNPNPELA